MRLIYNKDEVLENFALFLYKNDIEVLIHKTFKYVFEDFLATFPEYHSLSRSQMRNYLKSELLENGLISENEKLTVKVASRLKEIYEYQNDLDLYTKEYNATVLDCDVIPVIINLEDIKVIAEILNGIKKTTNKKITTIRKDNLSKVFSNFKSEHPEFILAAVPELSLQKDCSRFCVYVVNNKGGRKLIKDLKKKYNPDYNSFF